MLVKKKLPAGKGRLSDKISVRKTLLGKGVFARKRFRKGQIIGEAKGRIIVDEEYDSRYCIELSDTHVLEPGAPFRYLNHSCEPNCELFSWEPDEDGDESMNVHVSTLRTIELGEELTIDYAWQAEAAIPCLCAAERCRGWIVDADELHLVASKKRSSAKTPRRKKGGATDE